MIYNYLYGGEKRNRIKNDNVRGIICQHDILFLEEENYETESDKKYNKEYSIWFD